jgi:hypothetical protein
MINRPEWQPIPKFVIGIVSLVVPPPPTYVMQRRKKARVMTKVKMTSPREFRSH